MNIEGEQHTEGEGNFKSLLTRSRDKGMRDLVDLNNTIDITLKLDSPITNGPLAQKTCSITSWLVYSRKGNKRKLLKAQKEKETMNQEALSPQNLQTVLKQQHQQQYQQGSGPEITQVQKKHLSTNRRLENQFQAENMWNTITELGLTTGTS